MRSFCSIRCRRRGSPTPTSPFLPAKTRRPLEAAVRAILTKVATDGVPPGARRSRQDPGAQRCAIPEELHRRAGLDLVGCGGAVRLEFAGRGSGSGSRKSRSPTSIAWRANTWISTTPFRLSCCRAARASPWPPAAAVLAAGVDLAGRSASRPNCRRGRKRRCIA